MNHSSPIRKALGALLNAITKVTQSGAKARSQRTVPPEGEEGYMLLLAIFFLALMVLTLSIAVPQVVKSIQRDKDLEAYHRGMQYRRAIQLYYRKFHAYPPNVDALVNTNQIRFLRKKYPDPITGKDDWKPVLFGQNKTPTAMGFFGQPLAGNASTIAGIGPSGGGQAGLPGITSLGGNTTSGGTPTSSFGSTGSGPSTTGGTGTTGTSGSSSTTGGTGTTGTAGSSSDQSGQTFGGAGIIGFSPGSSKQSILVYKKKNHYGEWEFTYDPISDMQMMGGGNTGSATQSSTNPTNPFGGGINSPNFGSSPTPGGPSGPITGSGPGSGLGSSPTQPQ